MKKNSKTVTQQLVNLKSKAVHLLTNDLLFDYEEEVIQSLYDLVDSVLTDKIDDKHYPIEEIVDMRLMEYVIVLENSTNLHIKKLVNIMKKGVNW